jgi:hypothetical protein
VLPRPGYQQGYCGQNLKGCNLRSPGGVRYYEQHLPNTQKNKTMKKITIILALVLTVSTAFAFRGGEKVNGQALNTFNTEFVGAAGAAWTISKDFYKVTFTMSGQQFVAYYNKSGEFIAVTHNISSVQLPANLKRSLKKLMNDYWITDLFEITNLDEMSWCVTLETADSKLVLKSDNGVKWTVFQRMEK